MRIDRIGVTPVRVPLSRPFKAATFTIDVRATLVIRIDTDEGAFGEVFLADIRDNRAQVAKILPDGIGPRLIGADPVRLARCFQAMIPLAAGEHHRARVREAIFAADIALRDLFGRICGQPVHRLLGDAQDRVRAIVSCGYLGAESGIGTLADEAATRREDGYGGVKIKVGFSDAAIDASRAAAVGEAIGPDLVMIRDANQGWG